jgi:hypothetical protein
MNTEELLIDADGHILEPPDLWERYLEPQYRDRALRIRVGDDGREFLEIDGKRSVLTSPTLLTSMGGMKKLKEMGETIEGFNASRRELLQSRSGAQRETFASLGSDGQAETYLSGCAFGAMDLNERLELIESEGMAKVVVYPTLGLLWEAELFDVALSSAYCRAYNRWITEFCRASAGRVVPIAHLSLGNPVEAAHELERAVKEG